MKFAVSNDGRTVFYRVVIRIHEASCTAADRLIVARMAAGHAFGSSNAMVVWLIGVVCTL